MAYLTGAARRGRGETYPEPSRGAGGTSGSVLPQARTLFVDGDSTPTDPNGAAVLGATSGGPFTSITSAYAAKGVSTSSADADTTLTLMVSPSEGSYPETPVIPAYRNTAIVGAALETVFVTGGLTLHAVAGGGAVPASSLQVAIENMFFSGPLVVESDGSQPFVSIVLSNSFVGSVTATPDVSAILVTGESAVLGAIDAPDTFVELLAAGALIADGALTCSGFLGAGALQVGAVSGGLTCSGAVSVATSLAFAPTVGGNVTVNGTTNFWQGATLDGGFTYHNTDATGGTTFDGCLFSDYTLNDANLSFLGCTFKTACTLTNTTGYRVQFDGPSLASWYSNDVALPSSVVALVTGGYRAGAIPAPNQFGDASYTVSLDGTGASSAFATGGNLYYVDPAAVITSAALTIKPVLGGGELLNDTLCLVNTGFTLGGGGGSITVEDDQGNALGLFTDAVAGSQFIIFRYDGAHWVPEESNLAAGGG